jgi:hypothetical protein
VYCIAVDWSTERGREERLADVGSGILEDGWHQDGMCGIQLYGHRYHPDDGEYGVQLIEIEVDRGRQV